MSLASRLTRVRPLALTLVPAAWLTLLAGAVSASPRTERAFRDAFTTAARLAVSGDRPEWYDKRGTRLTAVIAESQGTTGSTRDPLAGTSWQLVGFQGGDGSVLTPDDRAKYTLAFDARGGVAVRVDCNRGLGTWQSSGPNQLEFGPLVLTRAQCPPGSLHDQIVKQWGLIRSYVLKDGHLFLSLMFDGGVYEFEPAGEPSGSFRSPVRPRGPSTWTCATAGAQAGTLRVTFYPTQPALVLLERGGVTRLAFQVRAASGARYEGDDVLFWEARGEATLSWMGVESTCKPT